MLWVWLFKLFKWLRGPYVHLYLSTLCLSTLRTQIERWKETQRATHLFNCWSLQTQHLPPNQFRALLLFHTGLAHLPKHHLFYAIQIYMFFFLLIPMLFYSDPFYFSFVWLLKSLGLTEWVYDYSCFGAVN